MSTPVTGGYSGKETEQRQEVAGLVQIDEQPIRVLMIEDDSRYCMFVRRLLLQHSEPKFDFVEAGSLAESHQHLSSEIPDVILLDLGLPDSNGLDTLARVTESCSGAPVIVLTGSDDEGDGLQAVSLGAQDYLSKHRISNDALIRCIRYSIERRKSEASTLRMTAIQDFTATLAHDLQVPQIGTNRVFDALLLGQFGELSSEQMQVLTNLKESNQNQLLLIQKLLEVYRYEAGAPGMEFKTLDLKKLLSGCLKDTSSRCTTPVSFITTIPDDLPQVSGDPEALSRLFNILLDNAIQFGDGTSDITITAEPAGSKLAVHVHNCGPAISTEVQNKLFQQFWQGVPGKSYVSHTGLGLYLCHRIASLHHGRITCHSTAQEGTRITVRLPAVTNI